MIRKLLLPSLLIMVGFTTLAQNKGFNFQGYARSEEGAALSNKSIEVKFSIYTDGNEATPQYAETHTVTTDAYGYFGTIVGKGTKTTSGTFAQLEFFRNDYYMKAEVRLSGGNWVEINKTELLSVPYAKAAENGVPAGTILPFGGPKSNIPRGYLACDGTSVSKTAYPSLYAAIGNAWGTDGGNNFNVPDLRGMFLRGFSDASDDDPNKNARTARNGGASGNAVGSYQNHEINSHNHGMDNAGDHSHTGTTNSVVAGSGAGEVIESGSGAVVEGGENVGHSHTLTTNTAGSHTHNIHFNGGSETRPKNVYVLYIIKY